MSGFTIAIVGRPNVGKSTLFNRLIGQRKAITDNVSGVTRDRIYGECEWGGKTFNVIDTGGFVPHSEDVFEAAIREQVHIAMEEADLLLFMVDVATGITDLDDQMASILRKSTKHVILVVNKVDNAERMYAANEFYSLGFEHVYFMAAISGSGSGEILDCVVEMIPKGVGEEQEESEIPRIAIVGQPNVGKSSMINAFMGEERNIVTDIAGTTRDAVHSHFNKFNRDVMLIDTAGIRKKKNVSENLEFYSVIRAIKALDDCDVVVLMFDAREGLSHQDLAIFRLAVKKKRGIVLVGNKWDLISKETNTARDLEGEVRERVQPFSDLPIIFTSAMERQRILNVLDVALKVYENRKRRIPTSKLNEIMGKAIEKYHPPAIKGKHVKIKYITQLPTYTPTFAFFCNLPQYIKEPYKNYLENQLREHFDYEGVPLTLFFRKK